MDEIKILDGFQDTIMSVAMAVIPLVLLFVTFQILMLRLPRSSFVTILKGTALTSAGLLVFLQGVHIAFFPFGRAIGGALGTLSGSWQLVLLGFLLGFLTTWGEPSVRILADQVEKASSGSIRKSTVLYTVCAGVALFVGLGMLRIVYDISLLHIVVPGYVLVIIMLWFSDKEFISVAVDAGGVATGPMANTFILALALGVSFSIGDQPPLVAGLGMVALIALAPIISVMALGCVINLNKHRKEQKRV